MFFLHYVRSAVQPSFENPLYDVQAHANQAPAEISPIYSDAAPDADLNTGYMSVTAVPTSDHGYFDVKPAGEEEA